MKRNAEHCLREILELNRDIEELQERINILAEEAKGLPEYDYYKESIESYYLT